MILRCTRKVLLTVTRPRQPTGCPLDGEDWYANLLRLSGRKCVLLTHAARLFTVFEPGLRTADLRAPRPCLGCKHARTAGADWWPTAPVVRG